MDRYHCIYRAPKPRNQYSWQRLRSYIRGAEPPRRRPRVAWLESPSCGLFKNSGHCRRRGGSVSFHELARQHIHHPPRRYYRLNLQNQHFSDPYDTSWNLATNTISKSRGKKPGNTPRMSCPLLRPFPHKSEPVEASRRVARVGGAIARECGETFSCTAFFCHGARRLATHVSRPAAAARGRSQVSGVSCV